MNIKEVLKKYKISEATLKNWIKTGLDIEINNISQDDLKKIDSFIFDNEKLLKRANKSTSSKNTISSELFDFFEKDEFDKILKEIIRLKNEHSCESLTVAIIDSRIETILRKDFKNESYKDLLRTYKQESTLKLQIPEYKSNYITGFLIQFLMGESNQSKLGSYYTPKNIIQDSLPKIIKEKTFLDPCSGSGFILFEIFKEIKKVSNENPLKYLIGNDINKSAAIASIIELIDLAKDEKEFIAPKITNDDGLNLNLNKKVDVIVMNPPYGSKIKNKVLEEKYRTKESFSFFINKSIEDYLSKEGELFCILPESILNINTHKNVRELLLNNGLKKIDFKGKCFKGVLSNIVILSLDRNYKKNKLNYIEKNKKIELPIELIMSDKNKIISKYKTFKNKKIIDSKILNQEHFYLDPKDFYLGIVTGNNKKKIKQKKEMDYITEVVQGKNFNTNEKFFISLKDDFQQSPCFSVFERDKIIYKFISKKINTKVDFEKKYTINSVNIYSPNSPIKTDLVTISDQLNSNFSDLVLKYYFGDVIKILKEHLCKIPIFVND